MRIAVGIACAALWIIYIGQLVSVLDFGLAQRLGLQEKPANADPLFRHLELWTARWDLALLWILPVAGILMLVDHPWWPYAALLGGAVYVDTGGREAAKVFGLRGQGVRTTSRPGHILMMCVFTYFVVVGGLAIAVGLTQVL